jgi:hypothetical protein
MFTLTGIAIAVAAVAHAQNGTIGLVDVGIPSVSPGPGAANATTYTIGDLACFANTTGIFAGMPSQLFGSVTFQPSVSTSFSFASAAFGTFHSTFIASLDQSPSTSAWYIFGFYTSGTFDPGIVNEPASITVNFTQDPPGTGGLSDSAAFSAPSVVPEPGSLALLATGATALCVYLRRRKA